MKPKAGHIWNFGETEYIIRVSRETVDYIFDSDYKLEDDDSLEFYAIINLKVFIRIYS